MKITMLGTGNALVTECYNTCFILSDNDKMFLVDGGGGSQILNQIKRAGYNINNIHDVFVTHKHIDHLMGIIWVIRVVAQNMNRNRYDGVLRIYAHSELIELIKLLVDSLLQPKQSRHVGERIMLVELKDRERIDLIGHETEVFDIRSAKTKQFGFCLNIDENHKLVCCGDEPCNPACEDIVRGCDWLLHEAFCLYSDADEYKPYEKSHSTVRDACNLAERLGVKNLLLYHTEDDHIKMRKVLYNAEGSQYFSGNLFVPDDLETIVLK